ncbi:hypothetical protein C8A05DRAFT_12775 [Staphylotrichum tortipilum]|uniref:Ribonucleases P/MRP subunit Pop8-like domain-containing protein n=1 Tax=Staphylotrichum tortipilum TaxID=2831512 RepID=A0AAN6MTI0_9PEZI|nr:hypothetical protein C8A05DRAFT_12775 [Staphylotrichum longicolle]
MDLDPTPLTATTPTATKSKPPQTTLTLPTPFSYAHLTLLPSPSSPQPILDTLQVRAYLSTALRQFLGDTGAAIPLDILFLTDLQSQSQSSPSSPPPSVWVRLPRADLAAFAAGVTAFGGLAVPSGGGGKMVLQLKGCGDWLGALVGRDDEAGLWE